jgi:hypothetical protein
MGKNGEVLQSSEYGFGDRTGAALSASRWLEGVGLAGIGITLGITGGVEW